jgi:adenylate cyclase
VKYRTKLLLTFVGVALLTNSISLVVMYQLSRHYMYDGYRAKLLSITASTATLLDGDLLKTIQTRADEASPAYLQLRQTLRRVRDANRRKDTYMKQVFTVMRSVQDPKVLLIGVDPEESLDNAAHAGDVYRGGTAESIRIDQTVVEDAFIKDEFGSWLRGYAPVRDLSGQVVGAVVVEAPADWVESQIRPIGISGLLSLLLAVVLALPAAMVVSRRASRPLAELHDVVESIGKGDFSARVNVRSQDEFGSVGTAVNEMAVGLGERQRVKSAFARYVSHQVMDTVLESGAEIKLSGDRRRISVLFCDIRGFTTISESLSPEKVVQLLNEYFERMVDVVIRNNGTLDKFIGDGMMVIFGAPDDDPYQEEHALKAAIEMQAELRKLAEKWRGEGLNLRIGIGINSGPAIVGNIGSSQRMDYTAIGDTVNLASRLESATKEFGVGIIISEYTHNAVRGAFQFTKLGEVRVRGRSEPVLAYAVDSAVSDPVAEDAGAALRS